MSAPTLVEALRRLHCPEKRWQSSPDMEWSYKSRDDAVEYMREWVAEDDPDPEPSFFEVCGHCGLIEEHDEQRDPGEDQYAYLHSLWPCPTGVLLDQHDGAAS